MLCCRDGRALRSRTVPESRRRSSTAAVTSRRRSSSRRFWFMVTPMNSAASATPVPMVVTTIVLLSLSFMGSKPGYFYPPRPVNRHAGRVFPPRRTASSAPHRRAKLCQCPFKRHETAENGKIKNPPCQSLPPPAGDPARGVTKMFLHDEVSRMSSPRGRRGGFGGTLLWCVPAP